MSQEVKEAEGQTFVEVALSLGGKSEEERRVLRSRLPADAPALPLEQAG